MNHENTRIHHKSIELINLTKGLYPNLPPDLSQQLRKASSSIALNFAEGCGRVTKRDRARFFAIARGSANEVSMIFDVARAMDYIGDDVCAQGKDICDHLGAMLFKFH